MIVRIKIWYSEIGGEDIPTPKNYPEELKIHRHKRERITDELVALHIREHIERVGAEPRYVMFIWNIITKAKQKYTIH